MHSHNCIAESSRIWSVLVELLARVGWGVGLLRAIYAVCSHGLRPLYKPTPFLFKPAIFISFAASHHLTIGRCTNLTSRDTPKPLHQSATFIVATMITKYDFWSHQLLKQLYVKLVLFQMKLMHFSNTVGSYNPTKFYFTLGIIATGFRFNAAKWTARYYVP